MIIELKHSLLNKRIIILTLFLSCCFLFPERTIAAAKINFSANTVLSRKPRLADRFYIESVLTDVFGKEAQELIRKFIFIPASLFGGACDNYEEIRLESNPHELTDSRSLCPQGKTSANIPMIVTFNLVREGNIIRSCEVLTTNKITLNNAIEKIFEKTKAIAPNEQNLKLAFLMFYPEKVPSKDLTKALLKSTNAENEIDQKWANVFYLLCIDPVWQLI